MEFKIPTILENQYVYIRPLDETDYEELYQVASDPLLWEHHPISNGYTSEGFRIFFQEALAYNSLLIIDKKKKQAIGCSRFYSNNSETDSIVIGHTFISRTYWGKGYNPMIKQLMLDYAFIQVEKVIFYVAEKNIRSQRALEKIGAVAISPCTRAYNGKSINCIVFEKKRKNSPMDHQGNK